MTTTHTHTATFTVEHFADPFKQCVECDGCRTDPQANGRRYELHLAGEER